MGNSAWAICPSGTDSVNELAQNLLSQLAEKAKFDVKQVNYIVSTGMARSSIKFADEILPESICLARGVNHFLPSSRIVLDLGAHKTLAIKCSDGVVQRSVTSRACASGTGSYLMMVSNILNATIEEMDKLFPQSNEKVEIQSTCAVFAESEIISMIHEGVKSEDIVAGVFRSLAWRLYSQLLEIGAEKDVVLTGGGAKSQALITALNEISNLNVIVAENPQAIMALGAALSTGDR